MSKYVPFSFYFFHALSTKNPCVPTAHKSDPELNSILRLLVKYATVCRRHDMMKGMETDWLNLLINIIIRMMKQL